VLACLPAIVLLLQSVISVHTELVVAPAVVTDARGHRVGGLTRESFRIFDNGRLQPISAFHHGESSVTLGLIVDRSQSMRPKTQALLAAVTSLLRTSRTDDELFAVDFNDDVSLALAAGRPFTNDADELAAALGAVRAEGRTALYDGVAAGLEHLEGGRAERRALVLVSDGGDNGSRRTYAEVLALARRSDAVIYAIGLMGSSPAEEQEDAGLLQRLCKDTGGVAYFPKTDAEIAEASATVASDLREQYTLGFAPAERTDGRTFRKIEVTASAPGFGRLRVRTRSGYIAEGDAAEKRQP
jgi:Ca-activated chloride channel family protein